ncbi:MAG: isoleucine--tRNA ligase [Dehalococcoidales bacterium]|nr:isoleucine--tRNA ligase [Dehalococcoidales bacterium]
MFRSVASRVNLPQLEKRVLGWWRENNIFRRSVEARRGQSRFVFYEGPPTANGSPGIHHVLARVFKDIILRYRVLKGYYVPRIAGWDTHGLPVELEMERELGLTNKAQIEKYGIDRFNHHCRDSVFSYLKQWEAITERIGFWVDMEHPYVTMDNRYIESVWWAIKQLWDKGLVYQGYRVTPHCPRCGTSLSSHEVSLGYQDDTEDPSVYIKFKIALSSLSESNGRKRLYELWREKPSYLLAWTTTPWTLPGNTALAVAVDAEYSVVEVDSEYLVLASALLEKVGLDDRKVVERLRGSDLATVAGVYYEPLFNPHKYGVERKHFGVINESEARGLKLQKPKEKLTYKVIATDFVSMDEGTGIVHIAPAYGEVDYQAGMDNELDFVHMVDLQGKITGSYPFSGRFVKDADPLILDDLKSRGLLFRSETIRHTYPFCWRCGTPLLYYAKQSWYIRTTAVKDSLIAGNREINWYPEHIKDGRFGDWLQNNVDWAFSRERYWGTPLPIWRCESCGYGECVGGVADLESKPGFSGFKPPLDLHRPFVDEVTFSCPRCGAKMKRVPEVIDCWFDSGAMPIAQLHYPFENKELFDTELGQADYICEAVDQTRGWFYSLHAISTLLFDRPCFRNVICLGHILDDKGEKMSKTRGNVVEPEAVIDRYGADALRWYFLTSSPPGNVRRFSEKLISEITRRFLLTLWNVYSFFITYANIDHFVPKQDEVPPAPSELDRWIISGLNQLILDVDGYLEGYNPTDAGRKIEIFVNDLSNWYVRRSRRRFWKSESDADKRSAYDTLYQCLVTLSKLLAPFTPFIAEELYQNLVGAIFPDAPQSIHLTDFPVADKAKIDKQLASDTQLVMRVSSLGRAARSKAGIKVRQPLDKVIVGVSGSREQESLARLKPQVLEELNVKDLEFKHQGEVIGLDGHGYVISGLEPRTDEKEGVAVSTPGVCLVAIPTEISPELRMEGLAREVVHRLQTMRREAGFDIADYIITYYQGDFYVEQVISHFEDYIKQETLSRELVKRVPAEGVFTTGYKLEGRNILLGVVKLT